MRLTSFVVCKSWASSPLRFVLAVAGIALGVAIPVAIHVVDHNTIESQLRLLRPNFGRVDFELSAANREVEPELVLGRLAADPALDAVGVMHQATARLSVRGTDVAQVPVYGLHPLPAATFAHYAVHQGRDLDSGDGEDLTRRVDVLIGPGLAEQLQLAVGDAVTLSPPAIVPATRCVDGVLQPVDDGRVAAAAAGVRIEAEVAGILASQRLGRRDDGRAIVASWPVARALAPMTAPLFQVNRAAGVDADVLRRELSTEFEVLDERSALLGESADERAFRNGVKVLGCLALVLGMFVIFQTLSQSLVERLSQIGLLRCLGASRGAVASVFTVDAVATALLGSVLGIGLGLLLAWGLAQLRFSTLGGAKQIVTSEVPWSPVLWTAALGVSFTLLGAAFPLVKARNVPALQILHTRGMRADDTGGEIYALRGVNVFLFLLLAVVLPLAYLAMTPILAEGGGETLAVLSQLGGMILVFGGVLLLSPRLVRGLGHAVLSVVRGRAPLPAFLVGQALRRSPGRFSAAVCGLSVVLMAFVALHGITAALRGDAHRFDAEVMRGALYVQLHPTTRTTVAETLGRLSQLEHFEILEGEARPRFPLRGLTAEALVRPGGVLADAPELAEVYARQRSLIASRRLAHVRGWQENDVVSLLTDSGPRTYTVLAVSDAAGFFPDDRAWAVAAPAYVRADFCAGIHGVEQVAVWPRADTDRAALMAALQEALPVAKLEFGDALTAYTVRDVDRDFRLFHILLWLIVGLAAVGLINTMTIAAIGRRRELGVLRALGVDRRGLRATFLLEGTVVGVLAAGLALVLAVPMTWVVVQGLRSVSGLDVPFAVPWGWVVAVPLIGLAVGWLSGLIPGTRMAREDIVAAVRYE